MNVFSRAYIDSLYGDFKQDPNSLPEEWQTYFANFDPNLDLDSQQQLPSTPGTIGTDLAPGDDRKSVAQLQDRVDQLVRGFRVRGHLEAKIDPLGLPRPTNRELHPENYGLTPEDFQKKFSTRTIGGG